MTMPLSHLAPDQAQALFDAGGFFILPLERPGQEFGIDTSIWAVKRFAGIKFLPPGLHLFIYSAPPQSGPSGSSKTSQDAGPLFGGGISVRKGILRIVKPREVIVRKWDDVAEDVVPQFGDVHAIGAQIQNIDEDDDDAAFEKQSSAKRRRVGAGSVTFDTGGSTPQSTLSRDQLRTLDPQLAPYPFNQHKSWQSLTSLITQKTLDDVLGQDSAGDSRADALMASKADEVAAERQNGKNIARSEAEDRTTWGKPRPDSNDFADAAVAPTSSAMTAVKGAEQSVMPASESEAVLNFPVFDLKRSWPPGAVGEELSLASRDKSWLLGNVIQTQLSGDEMQLLAQLQLAFILFIQLHNFSALDAYKNYLSLLCRSTSALSQAISTPESPEQQNSTNLYAALLLNVLIPHIEHLREDFFADDMPDLENFYLQELAALRTTLRQAKRSCSTRNRELEQTENALVQLAQRSKAKFGWDIGSLDSDQHGYAPEQVRAEAKGSGKTEYNLLSVPDDDDEYAEEGEDAPVVVEM